MGSRLGRGIIGALLAAGAARSVAAQGVRGVITDRETTAPIAGAIVSGSRDSLTAPIRVLSNAAGRFSWRARSAGTWDVEVRAIGYRPATRTVTIGEAETATLDVALERAPISIARVRVESSSSCQSRSELTGDASVVWNDVWSALAGVSVSGSVRRERATLVRYVRLRQAGTELIEQETRTTRTGGQWQPFTALAAAELARTGFRVENPDGSVTFNAPDAETLIAPQFIERHCYGLTSRAGDTAMVGLAFWPHRRYESVDVEGVLWADAQSRELRRVEFRYPSLAGLAHGNTFGGFTSYTRQPDGSWVIDAWQIRVPVVSSTQRIVRFGNRRLGEDSRDSVVMISEEGGLVGMTGASGFLQTLTGTVRDSAGRPLRGARIELLGTVLSATSDSLGAFELPDVIPGRYLAQMSVQRTSMSAGFLAQDTLLVAARGSVTWSPTASVPASLAVACPGVRKGKKTAALFVMRDARTRQPLRDRALQLQWSSFEGPDLSQLRRRDQKIERTSDWRGMVALCDVPGTRLEVQLRQPDAATWSDPVRLDGEFNLVDVLLAGAATSIDAPRATSLGAAPAVIETRGALVGRVVADDSARTPLSDAEVMVEGSTQPVRTGQAGGFRFDDLPTGSVLLSVRRLGYVPVRRVVSVGADGAQEVRVTLSRIATLLPEVTVSAEAGLARIGMRDFARRRTAGFGIYVDSAGIDRMHAHSLSSVVVTAGSGLRLVRANIKGFTGGGYVLASMRYANLSGQQACFSQVFLNGVRVYPQPAAKDDEPFVLDQIPVDQVVGVEVYRGAAETPIELTGPTAACGTVVIWTK
ncbi:MAG: carboxypeptidase regulatory-like domain-containing protein [Gemmatimonadaceae bacterium]